LGCGGESAQAERSDEMTDRTHGFLLWSMTRTGLTPAQPLYSSQNGGGQALRFTAVLEARKIG
jgi:hypothetical protein